MRSLAYIGCTDGRDIPALLVFILTILSAMVCLYWLMKYIHARHTTMDAMLTHLLTLLHTLIIYIHSLLLYLHSCTHTNTPLAYPLLYANLYQQLNHHLSMSLMLPPCSVLVCSRSRPVERSIISSSSHSAPASSHYLHYPPIL